MYRQQVYLYPYGAMQQQQELAYLAARHPSPSISDKSIGSSGTFTSNRNVYVRGIQNLDDITFRELCQRLERLCIH